MGGYSTTSEFTNAVIEALHWDYRVTLWRWVQFWFLFERYVMLRHRQL
jgi:hypothetical protein